jgi:hypothetical protein
MEDQVRDLQTDLAEVQRILSTEIGPVGVFIDYGKR